jgi:hypothetical protein
MLNEDFSLKFKGFEPTEELKKFVDTLLRETHLKSPSQSFLKATFTLTNGLFEGVIDITSTAGRFVAKAADTDVRDVGAKMFEGIRSELDRWKSRRNV